MRFGKLFQAAVVLSVLLLFSRSPALAQGKDGKKGQSEEGKRGEKAEKKARGEKKKKKSEESSYDLDVLGQLGSPAKGAEELYEFTYTTLDGKKRVSKKAWVKIDASTGVFLDRLVGLEQFKEGDRLLIFGKPIERDSPVGGGAKDQQRLIQAARVIVGGKEITVNEAYEDQKDKDMQWCEATVEKPGKALTVLFGGGSFKVSPDRGAAILQRGDGDPAKDVKKGVRLIVKGKVISEKPPEEDGKEGGGKAAEERASFHAEKVIIVETRAMNWYAALMN